MRTLSRALRQWEPVRVAAFSAGVASLALMGAYAVFALSGQPVIEGVLAVVGFVAIAITGFLYAWRLGAGGTFD